MRVRYRDAGASFSADDLAPYVHSQERWIGGGKKARLVDVVPAERDRAAGVYPDTEAALVAVLPGAGGEGLLQQASRLRDQVGDLKGFRQVGDIVFL